MTKLIFPLEETNNRKPFISQPDTLGNLQTVLQIEKALAGVETYPGVYILQAIKRGNEPAVMIISNVSMMCQDNEPCMVKLLGQELVDKLLNRKK